MIKSREEIDEMIDKLEDELGKDDAKITASLVQDVGKLIRGSIVFYDNNRELDLYEKYYLCRAIGWLRISSKAFLHQVLHNLELSNDLDEKETHQGSPSLARHEKEYGKITKEELLDSVDPAVTLACQRLDE